MTLQTKWRIAGGIAIAVSALLAYGGVHWDFPRQSLMHFALYWLVFLIFFVAALFLAIWDLRYIRAQYRSDERALFHQTLGDEDFRKRLREAERRAREHDKQN
ncbi:MAG: hypothetical protein U9Q79_07625 [Candidatus Hydrogenedentes bacterium]|nr:hypothetical protein [Candidatus Hydrogenedentota bacterium]